MSGWVRRIEAKRLTYVPPLMSLACWPANIQPDI